MLRRKRVSCPRAIFPSPVVIGKPALYPTNTFELPVVTSGPDEPPTAVLNIVIPGPV